MVKTGCKKKSTSHRKGISPYINVSRGRKIMTRDLQRVLFAAALAGMPTVCTAAAEFSAPITSLPPPPDNRRDCVYKAEDGTLRVTKSPRSRTEDDVEIDKASILLNSANSEMILQGSQIKTSVAQRQLALQELARGDIELKRKQSLAAIANLHTVDEVRDWYIGQLPAEIRPVVSEQSQGSIRVEFYDVASGSLRGHEEFANFYEMRARLAEPFTRQ